MAAQKRPKQLYREGYKPGACMVLKHLLPERLPYMPEDWKVDAIEVLAAGRMDDGREFQEVRVYARRGLGSSPNDAEVGGRARKLLAGEEPPEGLQTALSPDVDVNPARAAWGWFREQLGAVAREEEVPRGED